MNKYEQEMLTAAALEYLNRTSGKFEGEPIATPALWQIGLDGFADVDSTDCDGTPYYEFYMSRAELADYGLESYASDGIDSYYVVLVESEHGFVSLSVNTTPIDDSDCDESDYDDSDDPDCDCDECRAEREAQSMYTDNDSPEYIYPLPFDESAYLEIKTRIDAYENWVRENITSKGRHSYMPDEVPQAIRVTNNERDIAAWYQWTHHKPQSTWLYIRNGIASVNFCDAGRVHYGSLYRSNFGDLRRSITVYGTNGVKYYGTLTASRAYAYSGDARIRAYKNQSR